MEEKGKSLYINKGVEQPSSINPKLTDKAPSSKAHLLGVDDYFSGIINGDRTILAKAITLVESAHPDHQELANALIEKCLPHSGNALRLAVTGVPGVGKSTFIEALGTYLINKDNKIAVLAVDPSSKKSKGSILGDKTRMINLSTHQHAFIRPSPTVGTLGGVARKTRETIVLCEAAGYNVVFIETVGVGQSETTVHSMVDFFLLLMLPGAGDELQGIKRGIMELADLIVINKEDDNRADKIRFARRDYENALHLLPASLSGWTPKVLSCSSLYSTGINEIWDQVNEYVILTKTNGFFDERRQEQAKYWFYDTIENELKRLFYNMPDVGKEIIALESKVLSNQLSPFHAAIQLIKKYYRI